MRLLVVEDEPELASLLAGGLHRAGFATDHVARLAEAEAALQAVRYDLLILDLGLPDGDGMTLLQGVRTRGDGLPILILTARDAPESRVAGLDAGADDYVLKPFYLDELVARVKALLRRPGQPLGTSLAFANLVFDTIARQAEVAGRSLLLGRREGALLEHLLRAGGRVVSKASLEERLYGFDEELGSNAVEVVVHRLRRKLEDAGAAVRIHTVRGVGYLLAAATDAPA